MVQDTVPRSRRGGTARSGSRRQAELLHGRRGRRVLPKCAFARGVPRVPARQGTGTRQRGNARSRQAFAAKRALFAAVYS